MRREEVYNVFNFCSVCFRNIQIVFYIKSTEGAALNPNKKRKKYFFITIQYR